MEGKIEGFSLVEVMLVILVSLLILAGVYLFYTQGLLSWYVTDTNIEVTENARKAMDTMIKELSNSADNLSSPCTISTTLATNDTITFRIPSIDGAGNISWSSPTISYFRGGTLNRQLIKQEDSSNRVLCNNLEDTDIDNNGIIGIGFSKETTPGIGTIITLTLQTSKTSAKGQVLSATLINRVKLRNQ